LVGEIGISGNNKTILEINSASFVILSPSVRLPLSKGFLYYFFN